jgi:hypothetical protein
MVDVIEGYLEPAAQPPHTAVAAVRTPGYVHGRHRFQLPRNVFRCQPGPAEAL